MSQTSYLQLTYLDVGQKEKEATINANLDVLEAKVPRFLGDLAADPSTAGVPQGSTYFNTASSKLKVLRQNGTWANAA